MLGDRRVLLIGGSSHVGKSTLARSLASHLKRDYCSTDKLARHPGCPWRAKPQDIPERVADHYRSLSADELIEDVLAHYRKNVWPLIEDIVTFHATDPSSEKLVMEGSALLPELVITLNFDNIAAIWLAASNEFLTQRIYAASQYETKSRLFGHRVVKCSLSYILPRFQNGFSPRYTVEFTICYGFYLLSK
ncbi:MAG: hypothetical protein KME17_20510, partial [Cyanosarcina radialis HA8281-LM2]|nr:hypothetical protein [Cyanosarcina radialis HA8281-LM2]